MQENVFKLAKKNAGSAAKGAAGGSAKGVPAPEVRSPLIR
jgi:hypothetical protein